MESLGCANYIRDGWKDNIKNYKYQGKDNSLLYNYFSSPFCNWMVKFIPKSIAPNVITVIGFGFNVIGLILTTYFTGFSGKRDLPDWVIITCAVLYTLYYFFDICDGKHARNTGLSSPLGLLMDHGCDAMTTWVFVLSLGTILKLDSALYYGLIWLMISINFFVCTWEEYHTGILEFPLINGINEGTIIVISIEIFTLIVGQPFWIDSFTISNIRFRYNDFIVLCFFMLSNIYSLFTIIKVVTGVKNKKSCIKSLYYLTMFLLLITTLFLTVFFLNSEYLEQKPKLLLFMFGFPFAKLVGHLQLAHLAQAHFEQFRKSIFIFVLYFIVLSILTQLEIITKSDIADYSIAGFIIFNLFCWLHWVITVSEEMCEILGINVFTVGKRAVQYETMGEIPVTNV